MTAFDNDRKARLERVKSARMRQSMAAFSGVFDRISKAMEREAFQRDIDWARYLSGEYWGRVTEDGLVLFPRPDREPQP